MNIDDAKTDRLVSPTHPDFSPSSTTYRAAACACGLVIAALCAAIYVPSLSCDFVNLDDGQYVYGNPYVLYPSWRNLAAFFREVWNPTTVAGYYQPLTMASLMLDHWVEGPGAPDPRIYHATNILVHVLTVLLLFAWIVQMRGGSQQPLSRASLLAPALAALLFGLHPANVEAVSWVCQRKALLSTFFALAAFLAYGRFVRRGGIANYALVTACFILSMLAKPTGPLLPLAMVALDLWPYRRLSIRSILEKLPLFALAFLGAWVAFVSQAASMGRARVVIRENPLAGILIICHNVMFYLWKMLWPAFLSTQYPAPADDQITLHNPRFLIGFVVTLLVAVIGIIALVRRCRPVVVGLGGFLLLLGPAIGAVDFMGAIAGDRFLYMPMVMPLAMLGLVASTWIGVARRRAAVIVVVALAASAALAVKTWRQQGAWRDGVAYWRQAMRYDPNEPGLWEGLGSAYYQRYSEPLRPDTSHRPEDLAEALRLYQRTIDKKPSFTRAYFRMADALMDIGQVERALPIIERGLSYGNHDAEGVFQFGRCLSLLGRFAEAIPAYEQHLRRQPVHRATWRNLGNALSSVGRWRDAENAYQRLIELDPFDAEGYYGLGRARLETKGAAAAVAPLTKAASLKPDNARIQFVLAACCAETGDDAGAFGHLAAALRVQPALAARAQTQPQFARLRGTPAWNRLVAPASSAPATRPCISEPRP